MLSELEDLLKNEGRASLGAAKALYTIQEKRLYRGHDNSMRKYGQRWNYGPAYTCRLIQSGEVYYRLESLWRVDGLPEPTSEWQLRPLVKMQDVTVQQAVWKEAVKQSDDGSPSATIVEECVARHLGVSVPKRTNAAAHQRLDLAKIEGLAEAAQGQGMTPAEFARLILNGYMEHYVQAAVDEEIYVALDLLILGGFFHEG